MSNTVSAAFRRQSQAQRFLGMNPGPFGEIDAVRDWMGIVAPADKPAHENPKRPVEGFACVRSEVSGRRLWGLFRKRFGTEEFFLPNTSSPTTAGFFRRGTQSHTGQAAGTRSRAALCRLRRASARTGRGAETRTGSSVSADSPRPDFDTFEAQF